MIIRARAPLRLGLAGGGTDVSPYCDEHVGYVLNATIDRYAYALVKYLDEPIVRFSASDQQIDRSEPLSSVLPSSGLPLSGNLDLHTAVYNEMMLKYNDGKPIALELKTFCDAPVGSGLGSSSTIVVVMIKALAELLKLNFDDYTLAQMAFDIERNKCGLQGGRQDQYSATFGGFNFMEFYADDKAIINQLRIKPGIICELEASLILFYTGVSRKSADIIADQSSNVQQGVHKAIEAMHSIKREALTMKESLLKGDFDGIVDSMLRGWESKKSSAKSVSNSTIDDIYSAAIGAGASAGKVSGAGGGGFMMFFVLPERRMEVIRELSHFEGQVSNCHFTDLGAQVWNHTSNLTGSRIY